MDTLRRLVISLARRQMGSAVAHPPGDAVRQKIGQDAVDGRVRLAQDESQFRRIDEWHVAEEME